MIWSLVKDERRTEMVPESLDALAAELMSRTLHVETWGDPDAPRVVYLHGVTGHGAACEGACRGLARAVSRHRARPARPRLAPPTSRRGASRSTSMLLVATRRHRAVLSGSGTRSAVGSRSRSPPATRARRSARAPRSGDPARSRDRAVRGRGWTGATARTPRSRRVSTADSRRACSMTHLAGGRGRRPPGVPGRGRRTAAGATATARQPSSRPTVRWRATPPPFAAARIPTLLVLGERLVRDYDHLLDAHRAALGDLLEVVTVPRRAHGPLGCARGDRRRRSPRSCAAARRTTV